jgi:cell wall-associated NlpC family hydrolase
VTAAVPFLSEGDKAYLPDQETPGGLITSTSANQLAMALARPDRITGAAPEPPPAAPTATGVPNPYGMGLAAWEPNTERFIAEMGGAKTINDPGTLEKGYTGASKDVADSTAKELIGKPTTLPTPAPPVFSGGGIADAHGRVLAMINAALDLAARHVPYVWGGTSSTGVDCSGLIYYAARAAGISDWKRYVAQDYGHMGSAVSMQDARAGDIVFYDEGGGAGHVGIYLGNGMMVAAPQTGENVQVQRVYGNPTSIRRIFNDNSFGTVSTPSGGSAPNYNGRPLPSAPGRQVP